MDLQLSNIINVSVSATQAGVGAFNTSNLAIFTRDTAAGGFSGSYGLYLEPKNVGVDFGTTSETYRMAVQIFSQQPNILAGGGVLVIIPYLALETLSAAIIRTEDIVQYFGILSTDVLSQVDMLAAAATVQALDKIVFFPSKTQADISPAGALDLLRTGSFSHSRGLYYGTTTVPLLVEMAASYASRALSVNFSGNNTTSTMHMKDLIGVQPDPTITQTLLASALVAGADVYASFQGVSKVFCSGANSFFDDVYNQLWFVSALKVAGFNYLAQSSTKIPQTESGILGLKGAYRSVCEQAVTNQYAAPGAWSSSTIFGSQADFLDNISQRGYYIYSIPVAKQLGVDRAARKAPLIQIALKESGAVHSSSVVVNINA